MYELYKSVTGSRLYGTNTAQSDDDVTVLYLPPLRGLVTGLQYKSTHSVNANNDVAQHPLYTWFKAVKKAARKQ